MRALLLLCAITLTACSTSDQQSAASSAAAGERDTRALPHGTLASFFPERQSEARDQWRTMLSGQQIAYSTQEMRWLGDGVELREHSTVRTARQQTAGNAEIVTITDATHRYDLDGKIQHTRIERWDGSSERIFELSYHGASVSVNRPDLEGFEAETHHFAGAGPYDGTLAFAMLKERARDAAGEAQSLSFETYDWREAKIVEHTYTLAATETPGEWDLTMQVSGISFQGRVNDRMGVIAMTCPDVPGVLLQACEPDQSAFHAASLRAELSFAPAHPNRIEAWRALNGLRMELHCQMPVQIPQTPYQKVHVVDKQPRLLLITLLKPYSDKPVTPVEISAEDRAYYTREETLCEVSNPAIQKLAQELKREDARQSIATILDWVDREIDAAAIATGEGSALDALHSRKGDCTEKSALAVALMRALELPARIVRGASYIITKSGEAAFGFHAWVEVFTPERGWQCVDPSLGSGQASAHYLAFHDPDSRSDAAATALTFALLGAKVKLREYQVEPDGLWIELE